MKNCIFILTLFVAACGEPRDHTGMDIPGTGPCDCDCPDGGPCDCPDAGIPDAGTDESDADCPGCPDAGDDTPDAGSDDPDAGCVCPDCPDCPPDCNDDDPCTVDSLVDDECVNIPIPGCCDEDIDCDDGLWCNGEEQCQDWQCIPGTPVDCPDGEVCDEEADQCLPICPPQGCDPPPCGCSDDNVCNGEETWNESTCSCESGTPLNCDDCDPCTADSCDSVLGCIHEPIVCDDDYTCVEGQCICLPPPNGCDDGDACNGQETWNYSTCTCQAGNPMDCGDDTPQCVNGQCVECVVDDDCPVNSSLRCHWRCEDNTCVYY